MCSVSYCWELTLPYPSSFIIPYSVNVDVPLEQELDHESLEDFRSLSQTCRRLRTFALPLVWAWVEVQTVKQLGELCELLKTVPSIAPLIKSFNFCWDMDGDCTRLRLAAFPHEQGTTLDLAFRDRLEMFDQAMKADGAEPYLYEELDDAGYYVGMALCCNGQTCTAPGEGPDWRAFQEDPAGYDWRSGEGGRGPDGNGEDELIKNADQFTQRITEIVSKLTSLKAFAWETPVTPMPRGVYDVLAQLASLERLSLVFSTYRGNLSDCES